ncbi:BamA/TamA family outer membrane protein [Dyadobacter arcticus]|uniref:Outer membrane protein assembly factor BamA n=1 Tax=Dyadobacter arcticus TaxID=1078754 RepID=A0ABX0UVP9_9BACT|nr:BamA/TamA family outer membrane protein [Dyadobacter arcticus]NIJ55865.1 outer membrane protein assembly factor BamA [Dyadobacter arcticus]
MKCYKEIYFLLFFLTIAGFACSQTVITDSTGYVTIGEILVEGNHKTRSGIILREMAIRTGDTLTTESLKEKLEIDRRKVVNTNLFVTVDLLTQASLDSTHTDIRIVVKERWYFIFLPVFQLADRNFNEWWYERKRDLSRTTFGVYLSYGNVTGRADKLRFLAEFGFIPKFELAYTLPYLDKAKKTGVTIGTSYSINKTTAFRTWRDKLQYFNSEDINRKRFTSYVSFTRRNKYYTFHSLDLRWSYSKISDTISVLNPNYLLNNRKEQKYFQLTYTFSYDRRDNVQYALSGQTLGLQVSKTGLLPSDDVNLLYFYGSYRKYIPLSKKLFFNTGFRGRASFPKRQPYLQTIGLGYRNDLVRGYELYVVDGQSYGLIKNELKYRLFSIQKHLSFIPVRQFNTIPLAMYINTFADAGYVKNNYPEFSNTRLGNKMLYGAGAGLDVVTFYNIVARFNLTLNAKGEQRFFFNVAREF